MELTEEQKDRLFQILKKEMSQVGLNTINNQITRNRYRDLYDCIEDKEYYKDTAQLYEQKIKDYDEIVAILDKDMELLESIQKELET